MSEPNANAIPSAKSRSTVKTTTSLAMLLYYCFGRWLTPPKSAL